MSSVLLCVWSSDVFHVKTLKILKKYFPKVHLVAYSQRSERVRTRKRILSLEYDYIFSFLNEYIFKKDELCRARLGAINFHSSPKEHPGLGGVTLHEIDEKIDDGRIYKYTEWPISMMKPYRAIRCVLDDCFMLLEEVCQKLTDGDVGGHQTSTLQDLNCEGARWGSKYYSKKDVHGWLSKLPKSHIAHKADLYIILQKFCTESYKDYEEEWVGLLEECGAIIPEIFKKE